MDTETRSWESWLVHHPKAARKLMAELPVPCKIITPIGEAVTFKADVFIGNAYVVGRLADTLVTREVAERMLREMGYTLRDEVNEDLVMLQMRNAAMGAEFYAQFKGAWRWKEALRWALEAWEKRPSASSGPSVPAEPTGAQNGE